MANKTNKKLSDVGIPDFLKPLLLAAGRQSEAVTDTASKIFPSLPEAEEFRKTELESVPTPGELGSVARAAVKTHPLAQITSLFRGQDPFTQEEKQATLKTASFAAKQIFRPVSALQGAGGALIKARQEPPGPLSEEISKVAQGAVRGFLMPDKQEPAIREVGFFELEQPKKGESKALSVARLVPRATAEAMENIILFNTVYGKLIPNLAKAGEQNKAIRSVERAVDAGVWDKVMKFPKGFRNSDKVNHILEAAKSDPKIGDMVKAMSNIPTEVFGGLGPVFKTGDLVKVGTEIGRINKIDKGVALITVAGREISKRVKELTPFKVQKQVKDVTGVKKVGDIINIDESKGLKLILKREKKAATEGFKAGLDVGRIKLEDIRLKVEAKRRIKRALSIIQKDPKKPEKSIDFDSQQQLEELRDRTALFKGSPLPNMSVNELENVASAVRAIKKRGRRILNARKRIEKLQFESSKQSMINELVGVPPTKPVISALSEESPKAEVLGKAITSFRPIRYFDLLDNFQELRGPHSKFFYASADAATSLRIKGETARKKGIIQLREQFKIPSSWDNKVKVINNLSFTNQQILSMYYALKNPEQFAAIHFGNKISKETMLKAVESMSNEEKAFADGLQEIVNQKYNEARRVQIQVNNKDLGKVKNRFPIRRIKETSGIDEDMDIETSLRGFFRAKRRVEKGFTISRKDIPDDMHQPVNLNAVEVALRDIESQEHFINFAPLQSKWARMLNDNDYRKTIKSKIGESGLKTVDNWLEKVIKPNSIYQVLHPFSLALRRNTSLFFLGFNLLTMAKQFPSIVFALEKSTLADITSGLMQTTLEYEKTRDFVFKRDPQVEARKFERDVEEILKSKFPGPYGRLKKQIGAVAMRGIASVDHVTVLSAWKAVYDTQRRIGFSDPEATQIAHENFLKYQPQADVKDLPDIFTSGELLRALTQFGNQLNQIYNSLVFDMGVYSRKRPIEQTMGILVALLLQSFLIWTITNGRIPKDKKELTDSLVTTGLGSIPIAGGVLSSIKQGFVGEALPSLAPLEALGRLGVAKKPETKLRQAGKLVGTAAGLPINAPLKLLGGLDALLKGETEDPRRLVLSERVLNKGKPKEPKKTKRTRRRTKGKSRRRRRLKF